MKENNKLPKYIEWKLSEIMTNINTGSYAIPNFQRDYVWNKDKIIIFLNSILNDEPFGYIINWKKKDESRLETRNEIIKTLSKQSSNNEYYIIDGQQRLTSLFSIFKNSEILKTKTKKGVLHKMKSHIKSIYLNMETSIFEKVSKKKEEKHLIPLNDIICDWSQTTGKFYKEIIKKERYINFTENEKDKLQDLIDSINDKLRNLRLGSIELTNYHIDEVIEIFNKINTQGKKLTLFEIIHSKWYGEKIDLESELSECITDSDVNGFGEIDYQIPLDSLFLLLNNEKNESILTGDEKLKYDISYNSSKVIEMLPEFKKAFKKSCEFLKTKKFNHKTLPSKLILKWLTYLFYKNKCKNLVNDKNEIVLKYIYLLSINKLYSSSTTKQLKHDIKFVDNLLKTDEIENIFSLIPNPRDFPKRNIDANDIKELSYGEHSMFSNFVSYVLYTQCKDLRNGNEIKNIDSKDIDMHHIFPRNAKNGSKTYKEIYGDLIESYANLMPIQNDTNREYVLANQPSVYYEKLISGNKELDKTLESAFINKEHFLNDDYNNFINDRSEKISNFINKNFLFKN